GDLVAFWMQFDDPETRIWFRRFSPDGEPLGDFQSVTTVDRRLPVALDVAVADGSLHVAWATTNFVIPGFVIIETRSFDHGTLNPLGPARLLQGILGYSELGIAGRDGGPVVATWTDFDPGGAAEVGVVGRELGPDGAASSDLFRADLGDNLSADFSDLAVDGFGNIVVVWSSAETPGFDPPRDIRAQRFLSTDDPSPRLAARNSGDMKIDR
ncbi:MAG: hypothetical protein AAGM22_32090, partial [Acidobacteriota bacterium]